MLVVDDDPAIRAALDRGLSLAGFEVAAVAGGIEALAQVRRHPPDVILLDVGMPGLSGVQLTRRLRADGDDVPICILSAHGEVDDRVAGLHAGADDYVPKPFELVEVIARVQALLRRRQPTPGAAVLRIGALRVDPASRAATLEGQQVVLTRREFDLLEVLAADAGVVVSRQQLLGRVWGYDFAVDTNVVDQFVSALRRKLEAGGHRRLIHTVRGVGFVLHDQVPQHR